MGVRMSSKVNKADSGGSQHGLLSSESRYRRVFETARDGIVLLDATSGKITEVNPFMAELLGYAREELLGKRLWEVGLFKTANDNDDAFRELDAHGDVRYEDLPVRTKRGRLRVEFISHIYTEDNRRVIQCNVRDVTERKQAEEQLIAAHRKLSFHVENTPLAVIEWDSDFRVSRWSSSAEAIFGWKAEEVIGKRIGDWRFVFMDDLNTVEQLTARQQRGIELQSVSRNRNYAKDGSVLHCEWYNSVLRDRSGGLESVLSLVLDVTARRHAEEEAAKFLAGEQTARREAEDANRIKDEFLATLSHELRTPLTAIVGWARLLSTGDVDPTKYPQALEAIVRNAKSQGRLIDDLLDVSRIVTGKLHLEARSAEIAFVIKAAVNSVRLAAQAKNIRLDVDLPSESTRVFGDPDRLKQVMWNLLTNAIKFTPSDGRVHVSAERKDSFVTIKVSDTGPGIDPEFLPFVFERFRQADGTTTRRHRGLGLGLAIVRDLVELHGGTVLAESEGAGRGSTFIVTLPLFVLREAPDSTGGEDRRPSRGTEAETSRIRPLYGLRILIVDDEADTRQIIVAMLQHGGAETTAVGSVPEALAIIDSCKPDVLVSDVAMPGEDGYALIHQLRSRSAEEGGQIPALAITAYARAEDQVRIVSAGFHGAVTKPVEPNELIAAVATLANRRPTQT
jgi:PAS domain S-box-containing protein